MLFLFQRFTVYPPADTRDMHLDLNVLWIDHLIAIVLQTYF